METLIFGQLYTYIYIVFDVLQTNVFKKIKISKIFYKREKDIKKFFLCGNYLKIKLCYLNGYFKELFFFRFHKIAIAWKRAY